MHRLTNLKSQRKTACFKDKSDDTYKVAKVRRTLMQNFMSTTISRKFCRIFTYCKPNSKVYKETLFKILKNGQKLSIKSQLSTPI